VFLDGKRKANASGNLFPFDARHTASGSGEAIPVLTFSLKDGVLRIDP
jgi:hypothetical protein